MNATSLVYTPQPTLRDSITVKVRVADSRTASRYDIDAFRMLLEMMSLHILAQDVLTELANIPEVKSRFRGYTKEIAGLLNHARLCLKRKFGAVYEKLENEVCDIVDGSESHTDWCLTMIEDTLVGKISYKDVKIASKIGFIGGLIDIMSKLYLSLNGKNSSDYSEAYNTLKLIDRRMDFQQLNDGIDPDYAKAKESMVKMFCEIGIKCKEKAYRDLNVKVPC